MMKHWKPNIPEIQIAMLGANGSGKSALTVKYITKRYIGEYDPNVEDTYCKQEVIGNSEYLLWIMDTSETLLKDAGRYLSWADVYFVIYSITDRSSFTHAEELLKAITEHPHSLCNRQHLTYLIGNKNDMDRYRKVTKIEGVQLAAAFSAEFFETNCTEEFALVKTIFYHAIDSVMSCRRRKQYSPLPLAKLPHSESEKNCMDSLPPTGNAHGIRRARTKSPNGKINDVISKEKSATLPTKKATGLKLLKLFQLNNSSD